MKRKCLAIGIILLFIGVTIAPAIAQTTEKQSISRGTWLYVGGSGPGNYTRIQDAIDDANNGDTVFVYEGIYYENIVINKVNISLVGKDKITTIIDGNNDGCVLTILADNVMVSNFTVKNAGFQGNDNLADILINSSSNIISDNILSSDTNYGNAYGILILNSTRNYISDNVIQNNYHAGIQLRGGNTTFILRNTLSNNSHGSITIAWSTNNIISENKIIDNICLTLLNCSNSTIIKNIFENKAIALLLTNSGNNTIKQNNFMREWNRIIFFFYNTLCTSEKGTPKNNWDGNYWYRLRICPKFIVNHLLEDKKRAGISIEIDWHPAQEPYDIPGMT